MNVIVSTRIREVKSKEYLDNLQSILKDSDAVDVDSIQRTQDLMTSMQDAVVGRLGRMKSDYGQGRIKKIQSALNEIMGSYHKDLQGMLSDLIVPAYTSGTQYVDDVAASLNLSTSFPTLTKQDIKISAKVNPVQLLKGYDDFAKDKIGKTISVMSRTGQSVTDVIAELSHTLDTRGTPFHSVAYRAELVARTAVATLQAYGADARMQQFNTDYPEYGCQQQLVLANTPNGPCNLCVAEFEGAPNGDGIWPIGDESAPQLPRHPCCFCNLVPYFEGLSTKMKHPRDINDDLDDEISDVNNAA